MVVLSHVKWQVKDLPKIFDFETRMAIMFDSFDSGKLMFVDLVHEFPWTLFFVGDFLDLQVKKCLFGTFNCFLELFPILNIFCHLVLFKVSITISILPTLRLLGDVNNLWIFSPNSFHSVGKQLNDDFKGINIW